MAHIKYQPNDTFDGNHVTVTRKCDLHGCITNFEDLPNELIYYIFEYIDFFNIYKRLFNLNYRFRSLIVQSILSIKINIPLMSQSAFGHYNQDIIIPNMQRIHILQISNCFMYSDLFLTLSNMTYLRTLILEKIQAEHLESIVHQFKSLSCLNSLSIAVLNYVDKNTSIYQEIFRLSSLKYCKLSLGIYRKTRILPRTINEYSSIEHLIIIDFISVYQLISLLSYVPRLRYLSTHLSNNNVFVPTNLPNFTLNNLTHSSFKFRDTTFDDLEQILMNRFPFIEVLRITSDRSCMDANRWEQIILSYFPNLRLFDVLFGSKIDYQDDKAVFEEQISLFRSLFWIERQCFFDYRLEKTSHGPYRTISSARPYRKKEYTLYVKLNEKTTGNESRTNFTSIDHLRIAGENAMNQCMDYFPNITALTLENTFSMDIYGLLGTSFRRILPLQQVKILEINLQCFSILNLIELLSSVPNVRTLTIHEMAFFRQNKTSIQRNEKFQLFSKTNCITNITLLQTCESKKQLCRFEILVMLFPRMEYLKIDIERDHIDSIFRILLDTKNKISHNWFLICFKSGNKNYLEHLDRLINSEALSFAYKAIDTCEGLYLWW